MLKNYVVLSMFFILSGCIPYFGPTSKTGFGTQYYKYRCEKPGQCCEIGVDCADEKPTSKNTNSKNLQ